MSTYLHFPTFISIIIHPIDNTVEEWPANFVRLCGIWILIGEDFEQEQDQGRGGLFGGVRRAFIKLEIIIFWFADWIQKH